MKLFAKGMLCAALGVIALTGCGGGGSAAAGTTGVFIGAGVFMGMGGSNVEVRNDSNAGTPISTATVTINSMPLTYDPALGAYMANGTIAPDNAGNFNLSVTANGTTYTATKSAFISLPALTLPTPFTAAAANTASWTAPGGATGNMFYKLNIWDTAYKSVYSSQMVTATTILVPANTANPGVTYSANVLASGESQIVGAGTGSYFIVFASSPVLSFIAQ